MDVSSNLIVYKKKKRNTSYKKLMNVFTYIFIISLTISLCVIIKAYFHGDLYTLESFQNYIFRYGLFGPLFLFNFQVLQVILPILPGMLGCAAGSILFGPAVGFVCNYAGISVGSIIAFLLARKYGIPLVQYVFPKEQYEKWANRLSDNKSYVLFLFLAMLLPLFPDDYLCYLSGLTEMDVKKFTWIIVLGKPWCILAYCLGFSMLA